MIVISSPIHILTENEPESELSRICAFLGASRVERCDGGPQVDDLILVGPRRNDTMQHLLKRFGKAHTIALQDQHACAYGIWLQPDADVENPPFVQVFKHLPELGERPVLIAEKHLQLGELIVVPETCDSFVTLFADDETELSTIEWFKWVLPRDDNHRVLKSRRPIEKRVTQPETSDVTYGRLIQAEAPWLNDPESSVVAALTSPTPAFQLTPMLDVVSAEAFAEAVTDGPWTRRAGEIYTQDSLDIVAWADSPNSPDIVKRVVGQLQTPSLLRRVEHLTQVKLDARRELFAYRLRPGERILVHADMTCDDQLIVRVNWLLDAPTPPIRDWDFRFWQPQRPEIPPVVYPSQPNHAVFFLMGPNTPHDIPLVPEGAGDRVNIVMTFGREKP